MKKIHTLPLVLFACIFLFTACERDKVTHSVEYYSAEEFQLLSSTLDLPSVPYAYNSNEFGFGGNNNAVSTLGRVLFYDTNLSRDNSVSCASCHQQHLAFSDDVAFSTGIENRSTARNSLALGAFRSFGDYSQDFRTTLFWDGRVDNLHDQMEQTIANPNEMGMQMHEVVAKIQQLEYYQILTEKAFGTRDIQEFMIFSALEDFMGSIRSTTSKFDLATPKALTFAGMVNPWSGLTSEENTGKSLFMKNCVQCHQQGLENLLFAEEPVRNANNGLDVVYSDKGAGEIDNAPTSIGIFKVPALKNIELTGPYMHDGRFNTLEEVIDFYSSGIQNHANLHPLLKESGQPKKFNFTETEKAALVRFLKTMTDPVMTQDVKWSDPFL